MKQKTNLTMGNFMKLTKIYAVILGLLTIACVEKLSAAASEEELIAILKSNAGQKEKADACRQLATVGTKASVSVLASLLEDEKLAHMARYGLEPIKDSSVDETFRAALKKLKGRLLVGVIGSIGVRRDAQAVDSLSGFLNDADPEIAQAAARSLGSIGTLSAAKALQSSLQKAQEPNILAICEGLLRAAESLQASKQTKDAQGIYDFLRGFKNTPHQVQTAALRGAILTRPSKEGLDLLEQSLKSNDYLTFSAAVMTSLEMKDKEIGKIFASVLPSLSTDCKIATLNAISTRQDATALPAVIKLSGEGEQSVRVVAIKALGSIGDDDAIPALVKLVSDNNSEVSKAAKDVIAGFQSKAAYSAVISMLNASDAKMKNVGIELVGRKRMTDVLPQLVKLTSDQDESVRQSALKRIGELGSIADIDNLIATLNRAGSQNEISAVEQALSSICSKEQNQDACANKIISALSNAKAEQKGALLRVLSSIGNQTALNAVRNALKDPDVQVRNNAIRALGDWKTADAAPDLLNLAMLTSNPAEKTLCLRNFFRLTSQSEIPVNQRIDLCKKATSIVQTTEEKKMLLGALGSITSVEAYDLIIPMLDDANVVNEAGAAVVGISGRLLQNKRNASNPKIIQALKKTASSKASENIIKQANSLLGKTSGK